MSSLKETLTKRLLEGGFITPSQYQRVLAYQAQAKASGRPVAFTEAVLRLGMLREDQLRAILTGGKPDSRG